MIAIVEFERKIQQFDGDRDWHKLSRPANGFSSKNHNWKADLVQDDEAVVGWFKVLKFWRSPVRDREQQDK